MSLGDNFHATVGHFDSGLIVNGVPRNRQASGPLFAPRHGIPRGAPGRRCGKIENSTSPGVLSPPAGGFQRTKSSPMLGAITMLPALIPT